MKERSRRWIVLGGGASALIALLVVTSSSFRTAGDPRAVRAAGDVTAGCGSRADDPYASESRRIVPVPPATPDPTHAVPDPGADRAPAAQVAVEGGEAVVDTAVVPVPVRVIALDERHVIGAGGSAGDPIGPVIAPTGGFIAWEQRADAGPELLAAALGSSGAGPPIGVPVPDSGRRAPDAWRRPSWSPDGSLLFEGVGGDGVPRLYAAVPGAGSAELISAADQPGRLGGAAASPDGRWLAFVADTHGNGDIRLRDPNGAIHGLTITEASEDAPRFDASGGRLVFEREGRHVVVADLATRSEQAVLGGPGSRLRPAFAGDRIVFFRQPTTMGGWTVVSAAADGSGEEILASGVRLPVVGPPAVTADGLWVAVAWTDLARSGVITLVHVGSGVAVDLSTGAYDVAEPVVAAREGRWVIAFTAREQPEASGRVLVVGEMAAL